MSKILIADDASFMRLMIRQVLAQNNYTDIIEADNGLAAVELYKQAKPDLTLLDITMPKADGIEALTMILEYDPAAKVIMCSAIAQKAMVKEAVKRGALDFIVKPFRPSDLLRTIEKYLES